MPTFYLASESRNLISATNRDCSSTAISAMSPYRRASRRKSSLDNVKPMIIEKALPLILGALTPPQKAHETSTYASSFKRYHKARWNTPGNRATAFTFLSSRLNILRVHFHDDLWFALFANDAGRYWQWSNASAIAPFPQQCRLLAVNINIASISIKPGAYAAVGINNQWNRIGRRRYRAADETIRRL